MQARCRAGGRFQTGAQPGVSPSFFALLNLGFEYWEPTGGAISTNERKLVTGYARFLATFGGNEPALLNAAEQYLERIADRRAGSISACKSFDAYRAWVTVEAGHYDAIQLPDGTLRKHPVASRSPTWTKQSSISCIRPHSMFYGAGFCTSRFAPMRRPRTPRRS